jgi:hypothetical protein
MLLRGGGDLVHNFSQMLVAGLLLLLLEKQLLRLGLTRLSRSAGGGGRFLAASRGLAIVGLLMSGVMVRLGVEVDGGLVLVVGVGDEKGGGA